MARLGFVNPDEGDGHVVTSLPVDDVTEGIRLGQRLVVRGWEAWVRDDRDQVVWHTPAAKRS
jgi:hypothetical protein